MTHLHIWDELALHPGQDVVPPVAQLVPHPTEDAVVPLNQGHVIGVALQKHKLKGFPFRVNHYFHYLDGPGLYASSPVPKVFCPGSPPVQEKWAPDKAPRLADAELPRLLLLFDVVLCLDIKKSKKKQFKTK